MSEEKEEPEVIDKSGLPERGKYAIGQALPLLIFTVCALAFGSIFALRNFVQLRETASVLDAAAVVCSGEPAPAAAVYDDAVGVHPVVVFRELADSRLVADTSAVPEEWLPADASALELVLCIKLDRTAYRDICNESGGDSGLDTQYGRELLVELRLAQNGVLVQEGLIYSLADAVPPDSCLPQAPTQLLSQEPVSPTQIQAWLRPFVIR